MNDVVVKIHIKRERKGALRLVEGERPLPPPPPPARPARIAVQMAMAHRIEGMVRNGEVRDYAAAAEVAQVTRARVSQLVNLLLLAPDIQEQLLLMTRPRSGRELIGENGLRAVALEPDWSAQRRMLAKLMVRAGSGSEQRS